MLSHEQVQQIPKTTLSYWKHFQHKKCFGADWAENYIDQFDAIKDVYSSSFIYQATVLMLQSRKGFLSIINEVTNSKRLIKKHATTIIQSIDGMRIKTTLRVGSICRYYGISKDWYYRQKKKLICLKNPFKLCFRRHPSQLTLKEMHTIESIVSNKNNFGRTLTTLYYENLRNLKIACSKSTFFKYAKGVGYVKPTYLKRVAKKGLKANRVFEWLHIDITYVPTFNDGMQKVAFIKDNFSKAILHYGSTNQKADSIFIRNLFIETFKKYDLFDADNDVNILSDKGSENNGFFTQWIDQINAPPSVKKITAQTDGFPFSNSMSESTHSIYKTEFLKKKVLTNKLEHLKSLERFEVYYNHERFPTDLIGYTPMEILFGEIPDKERFKEQITAGRKERIIVNQRFNECYIVK